MSIVITEKDFLTTANPRCYIQGLTHSLNIYALWNTAKLHTCKSNINWNLVATTIYRNKPKSWPIIYISPPIYSFKCYQSKYHRKLKIKTKELKYVRKYLCKSKSNIQINSINFETLKCINIATCLSSNKILG